MKAFAYGVLGWSEKKFLNASIDYFIHACMGWNHNQLFQMQTTNNLNKRLAYAICEITHAQKKIEIEKFFELFQVDKSKNLEKELNEVSKKFPSVTNGKKR